MALLESDIMAVGTTLPKFILKDASGNQFDSATLSQTKLVLVIFNCNHCPYAIASWPILAQLQDHYHMDDLQIIAINPNNNPDYPDDNFASMAPYAEQNNISFPYLFDEDQSVAKLYKAVCTPDPYLFLDGKLFYHGRLTDNWQEPQAVKEKSMQLFIESALGKGQAPTDRFPSMGCSIKWVQ